jgi:2-oxoglutarate ferredoxin oxidoreductase subunit delta
MPPKRGSVEVDAARCKACGLCAHFCPKGCFAPAQELNALGCLPFRFLDGSDCTACGVCGWVCPDLAIRIYTERASVHGAPKADAPSVRVGS